MALINHNPTAARRPRGHSHAGPRAAGGMRTQMNFYWVLFSASALGAWLIGYGMGYIRAAKDAANSRNGEFGFSGDRSGGEI